VVILALLILLVIIFAGLGFAIHVLWILFFIALLFLVLRLCGVWGGGRGGHPAA